MSNRILKGDTDGVHVPQLQISNICDTIHASHKKVVKLCREVHYRWWVNQGLELQE